MKGRPRRDGDRVSFLSLLTCGFAQATPHQGRHPPTQQEAAPLGTRQFTAGLTPA